MNCDMLIVKGVVCVFIVKCVVCSSKGFFVQTKGKMYGLFSRT